MGLTIGGFDLGVNLPSFSSAGIGSWITIACVLLIFLLIGCIAVWLIYQSRVYNKKIILFENVAGQGYQNTGKDRARVIKVGDGGEELLYLRKRRVYRSAYGRKMGKNTYWFAMGQDGYWYNILLGDLDAKMGMLDVEPVDRDMRMMHVAIRKNAKERYNKESFMQKYGTFVFNSIFLLIMVIAIWLLMSKAGDLIREATPVAKALKEAANAMVKASSTWDSVCGGSGYTAG